MLKGEILKNLLIELYCNSDNKPKTLFKIYSEAAKECNCDVSRIYKFCKPKYIFQSPVNREIEFFRMKKKLREKDREIERIKSVLSKQVDKNLKLQERIIKLKEGCCCEQ